ncbi:MAG: hypothetical protein IPF98_24085 [Gemmatimonadetes bacterium]|nr:hypothetical protein [Gemmatimonadota bacterium]
MPSRGERRLLERGSRAVALAALGGLLWLAWRPPPPANARVTVDGTAALPAFLSQATRAPVGALALVIDSIPGRRERDWLRALAGAGTAVTWRRAGATALRGDLTGIAITAEPVVDPSGRSRIVAVGPPGAPLTISDEAGGMDSASIASSGARVLDATVDGIVTGGGARSVATTAPRDSVVLRPVLVLANAGWEGKFIAAALEEAGWRVDVRFAVAPRVAVVQGTGGRDQAATIAGIDTGRYAAVVAVDESAAPHAAALVRFVRQGGGLVVGRDASSVVALAPILPARPGAPITPVLGAIASDQPLRALGGIALSAPRRDAVVLDRLGGAARGVAARVGVGRVLMLGYDETWRWRMEGGEGAPAEHRSWWSAMVASVAYAPLAPLRPATAAQLVDEAPYAALVDALGEPLPDQPSAGAPISAIAWQRLRFVLLFVLLIGGLLAEWTSRRLRGAR